MRLILMLVVVFLFAETVLAQTIVKDNLSSTVFSASSGQGSWQPSGGGIPVGWRAITGFEGNGETLYSFEAYYRRLGSGPLSNLTGFNLTFWHDESKMVSDPRLLTPGNLDRVEMFQEPSNADWQTPVVVDGSEYFRFQFDLSGLFIGTSPGHEHFITITPHEDGGMGTLTGPWLMLSATGGPGSIGNQVADWRWTFSSTATPLTSDPRYLAVRLATIPSPGAFSLLILTAGLTNARRR